MTHKLIVIALSTLGPLPAMAASIVAPFQAAVPPDPHLIGVLTGLLNRLFGG